jgi:RimJ/RimL family protein N-acetyltransferase
MHNILIREATLSDAKDIIDYLTKVMGETNFMRMYQDEVKYTIEEEENYITSMCEQENSILFVAFENDLIVSIAGVQGQQLRKFKHCAEFGISVLKQYWGKGIGKIMTEKCINWCKKNQIIKKLVLHVNAENQTAINLYEKFGFNREGMLCKDFFYEERYIDTYIYGMHF